MDALSKIETLMTKYTHTLGETIGTLMYRARPEIIKGENDQSNSIYAEERNKKETIFATEEEQKQSINDSAKLLKDMYSDMLKQIDSVVIPSESESELLKNIQDIEKDNQQSINELEQMQSKASIAISSATKVITIVHKLLYRV